MLPKKPVGRLLADCRPSVGRQSAVCRPTVGRLLADCRPSVGRQTADRFSPKHRLCRRSVSSWVCRVMHHHYGMLHHVNCSCLPQFSFFLNLSVTCWLTVGRLSVTCRSTDGRQLTDSRPAGFLGSCSSQLPIFLQVLVRIFIQIVIPA